MHHQTIRKNKEVSACISYYNDIVLRHCPILIKWQEFLPLKIFHGLLTQWFWYSFKLLLLFNRFLHAQKIIIFIVVFWKHNCKHLFIFIYWFNFLYKPATKNLAKAETLQLGSTTGKKFITMGECSILVWKSKNSYLCTSKCHVM